MAASERRLKNSPRMSSYRLQPRATFRHDEILAAAPTSQISLEKRLARMEDTIGQLASAFLRVEQWLDAGARAGQLFVF